MNSTTFKVWTAITWIVSLGLAYMFGWWRGASRAVGVATSAAGSSLTIVWYVLLAVAVVSAVLAFRARGYLSHRSPNTSLPK